MSKPSQRAKPKKSDAANTGDATPPARLEIVSVVGDGRGAAILRAARDLGVVGIDGIDVTDVYWLAGEALSDASGRAAVAALICDPILQRATWATAGAGAATANDAGCIEVARRPGVTDPVAESLLVVAGRVGVVGLTHAASGTRFAVRGAIDDADLQRLARGLLANEVVDRVVVAGTLAAAFTLPKPAAADVEHVKLAGLDDDALVALSRQRRLSLDLPEMRAVVGYFATAGRDATDVELEMIAQTWSEHCCHKTFGAMVKQREHDANGGLLFEAEINSIFKTYIVAATAAAPHQERLRSVFVDNAGIVAFDANFDLALKVETHNHPSALEPFGGANTGIGGVIRDILGVSARPIANLDVLCFGPPDLANDALPKGALHPRRIADGVLAGIEDYGNKMGIPTVAGAFAYDVGYTANPLVFCGTLGVLPRGSHRTTPVPGDRVVVLGGRTGRDGLRGATFSSMTMGEDTAEIASTSVQIGHPINEKVAMEVLLAARDAGLYTAVTDCGAGGLSSAVGEMARKLGADIDLRAVPLKVEGLAPWEIWLSEAQERIVLAISDAHWDAFVALCGALGSEATTIGRFRDDGVLSVHFDDLEVARLDGAFLHDGIPQRQLVGDWRAPQPEALPPLPSDLAAPLLALLRSPAIRSKEDVLRRYDHEVGGGTVVKPLCGPGAFGPTDAVALRPLDVTMAAALAQVSGCAGETREGDAGSRRAVALAVGLAPRVGVLDPYAMAWMAVDEAVRNAVAIGADPDDVALLDNFCWGNPTLPDRMGALVRCTRGCHDAAVAFGAPYVSGKDSLNNEYIGSDGQIHAIPGTLLITAMAIVPDAAETVTMADSRPGDRLYVVGESDDALGGSAYLALVDLLGDIAPAPVPNALVTYRLLHAAIRDGLCRAVHDVSEGGLAVAVAEMALAAGHGVAVDLGLVRTAAMTPASETTSTTVAVRSDARCFGERGGRLVVAVRPADARAFEAALAGCPLARVGEVRADDRVLIRVGEATVIQSRVAALQDAFRGHVVSPA